MRMKPPRTAWIVFVWLVGLCIGSPLFAREPGASQGEDGNVRRFGAVGDGRTDDTAALQKAVDSGQGVIRLPRGVHHITRPIVIDLDRLGYTSVSGDGVSRIVMAANNFDRNPRYNDGDSPEGANSLVIRNSEDCSLSGLHITNVWRDSAGLLIENCKRTNITSCAILDCDNTRLLLRNVNDSRVSDCFIRNDRSDTQSVPLAVVGGKGNMVVSNLLGAAPRIAEDAAHVAGNVHP